MRCDASLPVLYVATFSLQVLQRQMPHMGDSMIVSSLWAFAVGGVFVEQLFAAGFAKLSSLPPEKARPLLLLQLFQTVTLLQVSGMGGCCVALSVAGVTSALHWLAQMLQVVDMLHL